LPLDTNNFGNPFFNEFLKKCSNEKPKNNYAKFMLGLSYQMMENYDEALKYYEMAKNEEDALNNMGVIYYEKGDIKKAEEYFLKASEKGNVASYYNLYLIKGDKKYFEIAKKLDEDWVLSFSKYSEGKFMLSSINPRKYYNLIFKWRIPKWKELKYYLFL
jgi:tetratricopeptide (TPR) repeat protein